MFRIVLAVFIVVIAVTVVIGKMINECARCMKDWEG